MSAETAIYIAAALLIGFILGFTVEWRLIKPWVKLALDQSAELHTDDRTPRHPFRGAGPDDFEARNQVGRRS
jgi:hypothetical protein